MFGAARILTGEVDRDLVPLEELLSKFLCKGFALLDRDVLGRIDLDRVYGPDPGVVPVLLLHVDELVRLGGGCPYGLHPRLWAAHQLDRHTIEIRIRFIPVHLPALPIPTFPASL